MLYKIDKADKTDKSSLQGALPKDIYKVNGSYFIVKGNSSGVMWSLFQKYWVLEYLGS